jgi:4-amino-4-deoxy-L-arabinose transferase-like glycosyltransferase
MKPPRPLAFAAFAVAAILLLARLGDLPFTDPDEGRNASVAREMLDSGDLLIPHYDGIAYLDKPALFFAMVAASLGTFGKNEAAARLPSALCAVALLGLVYAFCRREYGALTAALAVAVTGSAPLFFGLGRTVIFDMPLALAVTAAVLAAYRAEHSDIAAGLRDAELRSAGTEAGGTARRGSGDLPWWSGGGWHAISAAAMAVAVLLKGPVGLIVPGLVTVVAHLAQSRGSRRPGFARRVFAPLNFAVFFALTLPWFLGVLHREPDFASYGLVEETVRRYATTSFHRTAPWWYYGPVLLAAFFPWSALLPEGIAVAWRRRRTLAPADRLLVAWAIVVVVFFSTSQSKLPGYILAAVVALGMLAARVLASAMSPGAMGSAAAASPAAPSGSSAKRAPAAAATVNASSAVVARSLFLRASLVLAVMALVVAGFLGFVAADPELARRAFRIRSAEFEQLRPAFAPLAAMLAVVAAAAAAAWITRRTRVAFGAFLLFPLSVVTVNFGAIRGSIEAGSSRGLAARVPAGAEVACLECFPNGLPFYLGRPVVLVTRDGRELTSNYALYKLRQGSAWPAALVPRAEMQHWLEERPGPVFVVAKNRGRGVLDSLAAARGVEVAVLRSGWWGALLPASHAEPPDGIDSTK